MPPEATICPQCGGSLQVPAERDVVKCSHCGVEIVVRQAVGLLRENLDNLLQLAESARAAGNNTEAIAYFNRVLERDPDNAKAWFGKGACTGWSSTLANFRFQEMIVAFNQAIGSADPGSRESVRRDAARTINDVAIACYRISREHLMKFTALQSTWAEYAQRCTLILSALEVAHIHDHDNKTIITNIIDICKDNIEGVVYKDQFAYNTSKVAHLSDSGEAERRVLMNKYVETLKRLDPAYEAPEARRQSAPNCFVVTATLGDPNHRHAYILRAFRDSALQSTPIGRTLCRCYYRHGPYLAAAIDQSAVLRALSYYLLVLPGVVVARLYFVLTRKPYRC